MNTPTTISPELMTADELVELLSDKLGVNRVGILEVLRDHQPIALDMADRKLYWLPVVIRWINEIYR